MKHESEKKQAFGVAVDFANNYPFTQFMNGGHIDYASALLKRGTNVNVFLLGFGRINRAVFLLSVATNQFLAADENGQPVPKKVRYFVFDRAAEEKKKILEDTYYRYENFASAAKKEDYLPLPEPAAEERYFDCEIGTEEFYGIIGKLSRNENDVGIAVVSLGDERENLRAASEVRKKSNGRIHAIANIKKRQNEIFAFGNQEFDERIVSMAKTRNLIYESEKLARTGRQTEQDFAKARLRAEEKWEAMSLADRGANIASILGLKVKLQLLGLDLRDKNQDGAPLSRNEFERVYAAANMPKFYRADKGNASDTCARTNLAIQEHERWNAYLLSLGYVPASRLQILTETETRDGKTFCTNGKSVEEKRHGNLTTFEGLKEYAAMIAKRDGCKEEERDVIKYDFQLLDGAYRLLDEYGFKIVRLST